MAVPAGLDHALTACSDDLELLEVSACRQITWIRDRVTRGRPAYVCLGMRMANVVVVVLGVVGLVLGG